MNKLMNLSSIFPPFLDICVQADLILLCFTDTSFFLQIEDLRQLCIEEVY